MRKRKLGIIAVMCIAAAYSIALIGISSQSEWRLEPYSIDLIALLGFLYLCRHTVFFRKRLERWSKKIAAAILAAAFLALAVLSAIASFQSKKIPVAMPVASAFLWIPMVIATIEDE